MDVNQIALISLRVFHAVAALIWLGGGIYYVVAIRPGGNSEFASDAQRRFREWARPATMVMLATGVILLFEGLSSNTAGMNYVVLLVLKIVVALAAFWVVAMRRRGGSRSSAERAVALGMAAFVLGVVISTIWPAD